MVKKLLEAFVIASAGVFLLWVGFGGIALGSEQGALPSNSLLFIGGLIAVIAGEWFCWYGAGRWISPPGWSYRIINVLCGASLGGLVLAGCIILIRVAGIS